MVSKSLLIIKTFWLKIPTLLPDDTTPLTSLSLVKLAELMTEMLRREKEANIKPDPDIDIYMKVKLSQLKNFLTCWHWPKRFCKLQ